MQQRVSAAACDSASSREPQVRAERGGQPVGEEQDADEQQHEDSGHFATRAQKCSLVHRLALVVVPLDGEKHARAEHQGLENNEDNGDPIHFELLLDTA